MANSLFLTLLLLLPGVLRAAEREVLEAIEVSGNKEGRDLSETSESVTVLAPHRLNRGDQNNSLEVLNGQANVTVTRNAENFSIRGINNTGVTGLQKDNLASVFVDDIFQTDIAMRAGAVELWDIKSLEIHRGPQSTSQGVNSLAGALILQRQEATFDDEAALKLAAGSFRRREVGALVNRSLVDRKLTLRLSFNKEADDGFIENRTTGNERWGRQDKGYASSELFYKIDGSTELRWLTKLLRVDRGGQHTLGESAFDYQVAEDVDARSVVNNLQQGLQLKKTLSAQLESKTTLAFTRGQENNVGDGDAKPLDQAGERVEHFTDQFISFETVLRYQSKNVKNAFGIHAHQFRSYNRYDMTVLFSQSPLIPVDILQDMDKQRETIAAFNSLYYQFTDAQALTLGARVEYVKNAFGTYVNPTPTGNGGVDNYLDGVRGSYRDVEENITFLPKLGYQHRRGQDLFGASYAQGYRIGGVGINRAKARAVPYGAEKTHNYELSWKRTENHLHFSSAAFYTKWDDQQVEVRKSSDFYDAQIENASNSELFGAELEMSYRFIQGHALSSGLGYVQTRFTNFKGYDENYRGNQFPEAPLWTANLHYSHQWSDVLATSAIARHVSQSFMTAENDRRARHQYYLDLSFQYVAQTYTLELNAKNVLDQKYVLNSSEIYGNTYRRVNRPRELNARVTWYWL